MPSTAGEASEQLENLTKAMNAQLEHWRMRPVVEALMTLRGIDTVAAMTLVAEIGDFTLFARPRELTGFLGLVPKELSSGEKRQQGEITKTGNSHARRVLVEAAWKYRFRARMSTIFQRRQEGQPKSVRQIACGRSRAWPSAIGIFRTGSSRSARSAWRSPGSSRASSGISPVRSSRWQNEDPQLHNSSSRRYPHPGRHHHNRTDNARVTRRREH